MFQSPRQPEGSKPEVTVTDSLTVKLKRRLSLPHGKPRTRTRSIYINIERWGFSRKKLLYGIEKVLESNLYTVSTDQIVILLVFFVPNIN